MKGCCTEGLRWYEQAGSLEEAIARAAYAETKDGKRQSHQRLITHNAISEAQQKLRESVLRIERCSNFDDLHELIKDLLSQVKGVGELYCYDTARRIAAYLKLSPDRVYLHRGTRVGARALELDVSRGYLALSELPVPLRSLTPDDIEDFLCIYKSKLKPHCPGNG